MPANRYYFNGPLTSPVTLTGDEQRHLFKAMRGRTGDRVELVNGKGDLALGRIRAIDKNSAQIEIDNLTHSDPDPVRIILAQAYPRPNRLTNILEKSTELGVGEILLFPGLYSEKKSLNENQQKRTEALLIAALKQCGRLYLPTIKLMPPLAKWESYPTYSFYGDLDPAAPKLGDMLRKETEEIAFFVGPESGFAEEELATLRTHGVMGTKLHNHILRADTAPLVALSIIHHALA